MKKFWIVFVILVVVVGGVMGFVWRALSGLERHAPVAGGVLVWRAEGELAEEPPATLLGRLRGGSRPTLANTVLALRRAARDARIEALVIDLRGLDAGWAQLADLRSAVGEFRRAGKPVWACIEAADSGDYALATAADRVALAPEGSLAVLGVAAELVFMKDTLAKVGIAADFVHVGKYKSAPEQYTRTDASPANREMITSIVDDRYEGLVAMVAAGRDADPQTVRGWIDQGLFDGPTALADGLVDTLATVDDIVDGVFADTDVTEFDDYVESGPRGDRKGPEVALIFAAGTIMPGKSRDDSWRDATLGADTLIDQLRDADDDDGIAAVLLRVDSPGGSVLASDQIWQEVMRVREDKPVIVSMGNYAASGGYYIVCGADSIFAEPETLTGSIGVFAGKLDWSGLYEKLALNRESITRGENALLFSDGTGFSGGQRALFQSQLDRFYERFLAKVADGRGMSRDAVDAVAQGRVWTGRQALDNGLVDDLGGLARALQSVKLRLGLEPAAPIRVITYEKELSWLERLLIDNFDQASVQAATTPWPGVPEAAARELRRAGFFAALPLLDGRALALMPYRIAFD